MAHDDIDNTMMVGGFLGRWPAATDVFVRRGMACPGCAMAPFETLVEVAAVYGQEATGFLAELRTAAAAEPQTDANASVSTGLPPELRPKWALRRHTVRAPVQRTRTGRGNE